GGDLQRFRPGLEALLGARLLEGGARVGSGDGGLVGHGAGQTSVASWSRRSACLFASISRCSSLAAAPTAIPATSRRRLSRACVVSSSICCCAAAIRRAPSALAVPLACSTRSLARCWA